MATGHWGVRTGVERASFSINIIRTGGLGSVNCQLGDFCPSYLPEPNFCFGKWGNETGADICFLPPASSRFLMTPPPHPHKFPLGSHLLPTLSPGALGGIPPHSHSCKRWAPRPRCKLIKPMRLNETSARTFVK